MKKHGAAAHTHTPPPPPTHALLSVEWHAPSTASSTACGVALNAARSAFNSPVSAGFAYDIPRDESSRSSSLPAEDAMAVCVTRARSG